MTTRTGVITLVFALLTACGGTQGDGAGLPDESGDLSIGEQPSGFSSQGTTPVGPDIGGTRWRWVEAHCTEGPLDLSSKGFAQFLRVDADRQGLVLTYDHVFATENCTQTVVQRARPSRSPRQWTMVEQARVAQPWTEECLGSMEEERPGEVRRSGEFLEVLVQRSMVWCNGLEVRMVYAPAAEEPLTSDQLVRHYVAHFNRRDPERVAALFAESGSLVEPFNVNQTGGATRHEGRQAIQAWVEQVLGSPVEWLAMKVESVEPTDNGAVLTWSYMDPRLEEPMTGKTHFTAAAGEIYEARVELTGEPNVAEPGDADGDAEPGDGDGDDAAGTADEAEAADESSEGEGGGA